MKNLSAGMMALPQIFSGKPYSENNKHPGAASAAPGFMRCGRIISLTQICCVKFISLTLTPFGLRSARAA